MLLGNSIAAAQGPACPAHPIDPTRSLAVTDAALDKARFSFSRTVGTILSSMNVLNTPKHRENFLKTLLNSFNAEVSVNLMSGLPMHVDLRPREAALDPKKLLDPHDPTGLVPVALVNRLDLAPDDWSNCGEYRIVYSFKEPIPVTPRAAVPTSRFFLIFEARTENPQGTGFEGCRATANFWRNLTDVNTAATRAELLDQFYYTGIADAAGAAVQAKNYGAPRGQIRGNFFVNTSDGPFRWQLREWIVIPWGEPATFLPVPANDNPLAQFYLDKNGAGVEAPLNPTLEESERADFQKKFLNTSLARLIKPDVDRDFLTSAHKDYKAELDPKNPAAFQIEKYKIDILNRIGARFHNRFSEFQSVSQGNEDVPESKVGVRSPLRTNINGKLDQVVIRPKQKPNTEEILNRAGAVTCGGCHHSATGLTVGQVMGQPIQWPNSAGTTGFVHITEKGELSPALNDVFLPFRQDRLGEAVCLDARPAVPRILPSAQTVLDDARQAHWRGLLDTARGEKDEARQQALFQLAIQLIMLRRQEEKEKPGYFVTNRRAH
jgi:hypothetical protein